jgi:UDP-glucose 4-epimerase
MMRKVIVTGGLGFIGSNLVDKLVQLGYHVIAVDDLSYGKEEYKNPLAEYVIDDFKNYLQNPNEQIDVVFHLAAEARIQPSFNNPLYTCENNSYGSAVVGEFARKSKCKVVYAGSSSFYGGVYLNPYAFAKWQGEEVLKMYSEIYKIPVSIARFFNVYGPRNPLIGQYTPVVAIFEEQKKDGKKLTIIGDGQQRRDFTHVSDICDGLIATAKDVWRAEVFNLGTGKNYSINELANFFGGDREYLPARRGEARITLADISKTTELTGWIPKHKLQDYIKELK